jgi:hypothetical protein
MHLHFIGIRDKYVTIADCGTQYSEIAGLMQEGVLLALFSLRKVENWKLLLSPVLYFYPRLWLSPQSE